MRRLRRNSGMTLIELMIVVVIIGVLAALTVPNWFAALPKIRTKSQCRDIVSAMREARSLAVANKSPYGVKFNYSNSEITLFSDTDDPDSRIMTESDSVIATTDVSIDVLLCYDTFNNSTIIFYPDGSASTSGQVCIASDDYQHIYSVNVLASTGRVKMYEGY